MSGFATGLMTVAAGVLCLAAGIGASDGNDVPHDRQNPWCYYLGCLPPDEDFQEKMEDELEWIGNHTADCAKIQAAADSAVYEGRVHIGATSVFGKSAMHQVSHLHPDAILDVSMWTWPPQQVARNLIHEMAHHIGYTEDDHSYIESLESICMPILPPPPDASASEDADVPLSGPSARIDVQARPVRSQRGNAELRSFLTAPVHRNDITEFTMPYQDESAAVLAAAVTYLKEGFPDGEIAIVAHSRLSAVVDAVGTATKSATPARDDVVMCAGGECALLPPYVGLLGLLHVNIQGDRATAQVSRTVTDEGSGRAYGELLELNLSRQNRGWTVAAVRVLAVT